MAKSKDDELSKWLIVSIFFILVLTGIDIWYSSWGIMNGWLVLVLIVFHVITGLIFIGTLLEYKDPNYDGARKLVCGLCFGLMLWVGIHHATAREDKQVIIDSRENATK